VLGVGLGLRTLEPAFESALGLDERRPLSLEFRDARLQRRFGLAGKLIAALRSGGVLGPERVAANSDDRCSALSLALGHELSHVFLECRHRLHFLLFDGGQLLGHQLVLLQHAQHVDGL
jgi:hypothetical protein